MPAVRHSQLRNAPDWLLLVSIGLFSVLLFIGLDEVPSPLFQDETDGLYRILHFAASGKDIDSGYLPLLLSWNNAFGSFSYPAYFMPVALFSKLLGAIASYSELRAVGGIFCVLSTFLVFKLSRVFGLSYRYSLFASLLYVSSPLSQLSYRVAWDPVSFPFFCLIAVLAVESFLNQLNASVGALGALSQHPLRNSFLVGMAIGFLWWGYPAGRLVSIVLALYLFLRLFWIRRPARLRLSISIVVGWIASAGPMLWALSHVNASFQRSSDLLNNFTLLGIYSSFKSLLSQLTYFDYLVFWGDPQRRHATGFGGVLGFAGILLLVVLVAYVILSSLYDSKLIKENRLLSDPSGRIISYIVIATIPSAVTFDEFHALRSNGAFPFWAILSSLMMARLLQSGFFVGRLKGALFTISLGIAVLYGLQGFNYMAGHQSFLSDAQQDATYRGQSRAYFQRSSHDQVASMTNEDLIRAVDGYSSYPGSAEGRVLFEYFSRRLERINGIPYYGSSN